jgi:hypothetical protein
LQAKHSLLVDVRGEISEVVESAFTSGDDFRLHQQSSQFVPIGRRKRTSVMRMNSGSGSQPLWIALNQVDCGLSACDTAASDQHVFDAHLLRAGHYGFPIHVETVVSKIKTDIDNGGVHGWIVNEMQDAAE